MRYTRTNPNSLIVEFTTEDGHIVKRDFPIPAGASFVTKMGVWFEGDEKPIIEHSFVPGVDDPNAYHRFLNELMQNAPEESWDRDQSFESVAIEYVRYLESQVMKYRGSLEELPHATSREIAEYMAAGFVVRAAHDVYETYVKAMQKDTDPRHLRYFRNMADELRKNLEMVHGLMDRITPKLDEDTRDDLIAQAVMNMLRGLFR